MTEGSLEDVLRRVSRISDTLERSDNFSSVHATLERSRSPLAGENDVDLVLKVRDRSRMFIKGSTETGNGEGSAVRTRYISIEHLLMLHCLFCLDGYGQGA